MDPIPRGKLRCTETRRFAKMEEADEKQLLAEAEDGGEEKEEEKEEDAKEEEMKGNKEGLVDRTWEEMKKLWIVAGPAIFTRFSQFGITVISQAFVGHMGATELAALALISTVLVRFANGILLGMASALETLCGQAFGSRQYHMLGIYLQRSWIVLLSSTIFILPIFFFAAPLLRLLGQSEKIATMAGILSLWFIPVVFSYIFSFTLQMYLQAQSRNFIISYLAAISLATHLFFSWLTSYKLRWGMSGIMGSMILANWVPIIGQMAFITCGGCPDTWNGFSSLAFNDMWLVVKLSLSSGAMLCLEFWYNTILVLLTGYMDDAEIAINALTICLNINGWEMMTALGFLAAASVRVSNELGRGSAKAAKFAIVIVVSTSLAIGIIFTLISFLFSGKISYIFTDNPEVSRTVVSLSPLLAFSILLNSTQPVLSGVAVGAGLQSTVAYVNFVCYYLVGIPIGAVLSHAMNLRIEGIWIGMLVGTAIQTIALIFLIWRTDWDHQVSLAFTRVNKWLLPENEKMVQLTEHH